MKSKWSILVLVALIVFSACGFTTLKDQVSDQSTAIAELQSEIATLKADIEITPTVTAPECSGPGYSGVDGFLLQEMMDISPFFVSWFGFQIKVEVWGLSGGLPNDEGDYLYSFTQVDHPEICPCYLAFEGYTPTPGRMSLEEYWTLWGQTVDACNWGLHEK